jgi:hypothetical protein
MMIMIEDSVTEYEDLRIFFGLLTVRTYTTYWRLSNASKFPKGLWKKSSGAIIWARDLIDRIYADLVTERQKSRMLATQVAAEMHTYTGERSTHRAIYKQFEKPVAPLSIPETRENVMRATTRAVASPTRTPQDTEPEDAEAKRPKDEIEQESEEDMDEKPEDEKRTRRRK